MNDKSASERTLADNRLVAVISNLLIQLILYQNTNI